MSTEFKPQYVAANVIDIFGAENLAAAFITGGTASGFGSPHCDIDIVVCHRDQQDQARRKTFTDFYFKMHEDFNRTPDVTYPGEVMSVSEMEYGLSGLAEIEPTTVIEDPDVFDWISWAGMLISKKDLLVDPTPELRRFQGMAREIVDTWCNRLFDATKLTEGTGLPSDKDKMLGRLIICPGFFEGHA